MLVSDCRQRVFDTTVSAYNLTDDQLAIMLCALGNQKGPCKGDSGGPYSLINHGQHVLVNNPVSPFISSLLCHNQVGVSSWSVSSEAYCNIGVHGAAEISPLRSWIDAHIQLHGNRTFIIFDYTLFVYGLSLIHI